MPADTAADVDRAVEAAQRAFPEWSAMLVSERAAAIARIADGIKGAVDDFAAIVTSEMGSPISYAKVVQAGLPYQVASSFVALADGFAWEEELKPDGTLAVPESLRARSPGRWPAWRLARSLGHRDRGDQVIKGLRVNGHAARSGASVLPRERRSAGAAAAVISVAGLPPHRVPAGTRSPFMRKESVSRTDPSPMVVP